VVSKQIVCFTECKLIPEKRVGVSSTANCCAKELWASPTCQKVLERNYYGILAYRKKKKRKVAILDIVLLFSLRTFQVTYLCVNLFVHFLCNFRVGLNNRVLIKKSWYCNNKQGYSNKQMRSPTFRTFKRSSLATSLVVWTSERKNK